MLDAVFQFVLKTFLAPLIMDVLDEASTAISDFFTRINAKFKAYMQKQSATSNTFPD